MDDMNHDAPHSALSLEQTMARLDELTEILGASHLPLDEALTLYQEAMMHVQHAQTLLDKADATLRILDQGQVKPFDVAV